MSNLVIRKGQLKITLVFAAKQAQRPPFMHYGIVVFLLLSFARESFSSMKVHVNGELPYFFFSIIELEG